MSNAVMEDWDLGLTAQQDREVRAVLAQWEEQRRRLAVAEMRQMQAAGGERFFFQDATGNGGEVKMMIHPVSYHYWGNRLGYKCWEDQSFIREYLRDNPEARVKNRSATPTVSLATGLGAVAQSNNRFHKVYN